ncbi:MAG TPA: FG-GAP-like repeat-containing protein, partial [Gemmataceae bacterium]|nr:FG-GAP-like repeat-containing protein [Gemmataceae bacterium]
EDPSRECRIDAALALTKMPPASRAAIPQLIQALEDKEVFLRMNAAIALFRLKEEARPAVATLIRGIKDDENHTNLGGFTFTIQEIMTLALGRASAGTEEGVPTLIEILTQGATVELRRAAVRALGEVGPPSKPAAPHLRALLKSHNAETREAAAESLKRIGEPVELAEEGRARPDEFELPVPERKYLWQIEHHGNVLAKHGFGPFSTAVKAADPVALTRLLSDNFRGTEVQNPRRVRSTGFVEVERLQDAGHPPASLSRSAFVDRLLAFRRAFPSQPPNVKLALMGLSPKVRGDLDGPWQGTAQLRLYGEHAPGAPAEIVALLRYEIPRPTEEALAKPGWLRGAGVEQVLTAKAPRYLFADVARERGLDPDRLHDNWTGSRFQPGSGGAYVGDFNRDGILDILIADINGHFLYQGGTGGKFQDVTTAIGLPARPTARPYAAWLDIDGDGWDDLILGGRVYRNEAGARFTDYTDRCRLRLPTDTGGIVVADYDRDGKLDLYVTRNGRPGGNSWLAGHCDDPRGNTLFKNLGDWRFEDVTKAAGASGDRRSTFTAAWLDANDDGWPDLHVPNEFGDGVLLVNKGDGTFAPQPLADRPADFGTMGLAVGDVNNDGRIDIYCANMYSKAGTRVIGNLAPDAFPPPVMERMRRFVAGSQLHLNKGGTKFEQVGPKMQVAACGWAYGACLADLDNDGWLDVFGTAGYISQDRNKPDG